MRIEDVVMRARVGHRGVTIVEFLGASMIATIIGGSIILLMNGMRQAYQAHTTFRQLSGYLDVAATTLRNDIWAATNATKTGDGSCVANDWLRLEKSGGSAAIWPIRYCLDKGDLSNIKLQRQLNDGTSWVVAQNIVEASTTATVTIPEIKLDLWVSRTVNGRAYPRQIRDLRYYLQVP